MATVEERLSILEKQLIQHIGSQPGAAIAGTPHPDLSAASRGAYTLTKVTTDRALDADSTTLAEVADVLGTLLKDLQAIKVVG